MAELHSSIDAAAPARFSPFPLPEKRRQNPSHWSEAELRRYGIPPLPDQSAQPVLYDAWMTVFGRKLDFHAFRGATDSATSDFHPSFRLGSYADSIGGSYPTRFETSQNWSGAYLEAIGGKTFTQVWGTWIVPSDAKLPPHPDKDSNYHMSTWIGLDGQRRYPDISLPQIGTDLKVPGNGGTPTVDAWVQWWAPGAPGKNDPVILEGFPVAPGDTICCGLVVAGAHVVWLFMLNENPETPAFVAIEANAPSVLGRQLPVLGGTAEWIVERPQIVGETSLQPFPAYGQVVFTGCWAVEGNGSTAFGRNLESPRFIRMFDILQGPPRTRFISMPNWRMTDRSDPAAITVSSGDVWF